MPGPDHASPRPAGTSDGGTPAVDRAPPGEAPRFAAEAPGPSYPGEAPGLDAIAAMAEAARAAFPPPFAALAAELRLRVEEWPEDAMLDDLGIEDPYDLTGLYEGVPLTERSASDPPLDPGRCGSSAAPCSTSGPTGATWASRRWSPTSPSTSSRITSAGRTTTSPP